ncbi:hypothetical protein LXA43DRAFT_1090964 [Ganoderma leucocontextum]|nr:hypothetical protein LXA43DRAFT_1090964 [Ganoderma leucocontextum]
MSHPIDTRPEKRTRLSDDSDNPEPSTSHASSSSTAKSKLKRHAEFWFEDGNIVLVAQRTAFRIYRGLLSSQSTVFSDMFASSSSSADETFDECPVVHLSDSPHDLAHLLRVLLPKSRIHYQATDADPDRTFDEVFALVRLAHKYHIQQVQDQALAALQLFDFTNDFNTFFAGPSNNNKSLLQRRPQAIGAANLARLTDTPSMLPLALYQCTYLGSTVLDGWKRCDGTVEHLSPTDLRRCIDARIALAQEHVFFLSQIFDETPSARCEGPGHCQERFCLIHRIIMRSPDVTKDMALMDWTSMLRTWADGAMALCKACGEELVDRNRRERRRIWNKLPEIFNIEVEVWGEPESESKGEAHE